MLALTKLLDWLRINMGAIMKVQKRTEPVATIDDPTQFEEKVRRRAYELYEARGREDGHELEDWLKAEAEIAGGRQKAAAA